MHSCEQGGANDCKARANRRARSTLVRMGVPAIVACFAAPRLWPHVYGSASITTRSGFGNAISSSGPTAIRTCIYHHKVRSSIGNKDPGPLRHAARTGIVCSADRAVRPCPCFQQIFASCRLQLQKPRLPPFAAGEKPGEKNAQKALNLFLTKNNTSLIVFSGKGKGFQTLVLLASLV